MSIVATTESVVRQYLENYQLRLEFYEEFGKVIKVYTNNGIFGVKSIPARKGVDFVKQIQALYQRGYNRIVPVFPAMDQRYGVIVGDQMWYLTPWLPDEVKGESEQRNKQMFRELARLHTLSVKDKEISSEEREDHYESTKSRWERQKSFLEEFVRMADNKWYMSPFELQYTAYHHDILQAMNYSVQKLNDWYEETKDDKKMRTVITHGKVSINHFLYSENGYGHFINMEEAGEAAPHFDLLPFVIGQLKTYPKQADDILELLSTYQQYFPWREGELVLFNSYLASPENCVRVVEEFFHKKSDLTESALCRKLQTQYWLLKNAEYMIMKIEQAKAAQAQAAEAAAAAASAT